MKQRWFAYRISMAEYECKKCTVKIPAGTQYIRIRSPRSAAFCVSCYGKLVDEGTDRDIFVEPSGMISL